jgi:hypothetical protein
MLMDLTIEPKRIVTSGLPALKPVRLPAIQDAGHLAALDDLGKRAMVQVTAHDLPARAHLLRDLAHAHALRVEAHDIGVVGQPPRPTLLAQQLVFRRLDCSVLATERCLPSGNVSTPSQTGILLAQVAIEN